jgi:hypothetical protein
MSNFLEVLWWTNPSVVDVSKKGNYFQLHVRRSQSCYWDSPLECIIVRIVERCCWLDFLTRTFAKIVSSGRREILYNGKDKDQDMSSLWFGKRFRRAGI